MTKKNILSAIAALAMSVSTLAGSAFSVNASTADGTTDPNFRPRYEVEVEEPEYELAPPICILSPEDIPAQAWDSIFGVMDQNDDGAVRVVDAIVAKKHGDNALSDTICRYIVNGGYTEDITMSPVPLSEIENYIRKDQFELVSVWKDEINDGKPYMARFMFLNKTAGSFFVYETPFVSAYQGFINLWDVDNDGTVSEKDAAQAYLDGCSEMQAISISSYAKDGFGAFAAHTNTETPMAAQLEYAIANYYGIVGIDGWEITAFSYSGGLLTIRF